MNVNLVQTPTMYKSEENRSFENSRYNIAICIPTYQRPLLLKKLIESIVNSNINKQSIKDVIIIVVDNDINKTAGNIVAELKESISDIWQLQYFNYAEKGLASVRNELFKRALEHNPDFIVGIDDDEYVTPEWLNELVSTITTTNGDMAVAPYIPIFDPPVPSYISYWFKYPKLSNNQQIKFFHGGNFILRVSFLLKQKIRFDKRFNTTGAEDTFFGMNSLAKGGRIYWAGKAIAYETFQKNRASLQWLIKRRFRTAITYTYILLLEKKYLLLIKKIAVNIIYLIIGIIGLILMLTNSKFKYWGILKVAEALGGFAGMVNIKFHEYQNPA